jgi:5'(3')-deoxyribonucleotidase
MIDSKSIAFDIDGVIANTMQLFIDIARQDYGVDWILYEDITSYSLEKCLDLDPKIIKDILRRLLDGDYQIPLTPVEGAIKALGRIGNQHPLLMVTARPIMGPIRQWLEGLLHPYGVTTEIILTGNFEAKAEVLLERKMTHFVEDRLETCFLLDQSGIVPILFKQPWNRQPHSFTEVTTWDDLARLIDCQ